MPQPIKRYYIRRPDGSITTEEGKIFRSEDVDMEPTEYGYEGEVSEELPEEPTPYEAEEDRIEYERRAKKKRRQKAVFFNNKKTLKGKVKKFLYSRPRSKKAITWRPRLEKNPKPKNVKFFQGQQQPKRRAIIRRR